LLERVANRQLPSQIRLGYAHDAGITVDFDSDPACIEEATA
jgi:type VI secretion system protein VasG